MTSVKYTNAPPAVVKRRRKSGKLGQGESSREASAESNDETATDNDAMAGDDTDTASLASPRLSSSSSLTGAGGGAPGRMMMMMRMREDSLDDTSSSPISAALAPQPPHAPSHHHPLHPSALASHAPVTQTGIVSTAAAAAGEMPSSSLARGGVESGGGGMESNTKTATHHPATSHPNMSTTATPPATAAGTGGSVPTKWKRPHTLIAAATANSSMSTLDEVIKPLKDAMDTSRGYEGSIESGVDESGLSTYDGDVSSAPGGGAGATMRKIKAQHPDELPHHHQHNPTASSYPPGTLSETSRRGSEVLPGSGLSKMSLASDFVDLDEEEQRSIAADAVMVTSSSIKRPASASRIVPTGGLETGVGAGAGAGLLLGQGAISQSHLSSTLPPAPHGFLARMQAEELQARMREIIDDKTGRRPYKISSPPVDRPVRIYADGVYDLFHYGHALQLRQCKLFFPSVHLLVGVCSDELVLKHKASPVLKSVERYESVRNCKWVDEVIEDAPWQVDQAFLDKHQIDYVAHDEEPYVSLDSSDVYSYVKSKGQFLPTRRTDGVSTSELLQRIVEGYTHGAYDGKLDKIGAGNLAWSEKSHEAAAAAVAAISSSSPCPGGSGTRPHSPSGGGGYGSGRRSGGRNSSGLDSGMASPAHNNHLQVPDTEMHDVTPHTA